MEKGPAEVEKKVENDLAALKEKADETQKELDQTKETARELEEENQRRVQAIEAMYNRTKDAVEEVQTKFEENLKSLEANEQELNSKVSSGVDLEEEKYRLQNEKVLLLSEKTETMERILLDLMALSGKGIFLPQT